MNKKDKNGIVLLDRVFLRSTFDKLLPVGKIDIKNNKDI